MTKFAANPPKTSGLASGRPARRRVGECPTCGRPFKPGSYRCGSDVDYRDGCGRDLTDVQAAGGSR